MVSYTWFNEELPSDLKYTQVYGITFSDDKRILLRIEDGKYRLTGGKPEKGETYEETVIRENIEEINIEVEDLHYLGYLLVKEDDLEPYAQVRMITRIKKINPNRPDIDNGKLYDRQLVSLANVKDYLKYEEAGNDMIDAAIKLATEKYNFKEQNNNEELV